MLFKEYVCNVYEKENGKILKLQIFFAQLIYFYNVALF